MAHITFQESMRQQRELRQQAIATAIGKMDAHGFAKPADRALALLLALQEQGYTISRMTREHIAHIAKQHG